jgi:hypothetical protein
MIAEELEMNSRRGYTAQPWYYGDLCQRIRLVLTMPEKFLKDNKEQFSMYDKRNQ